MATELSPRVYRHSTIASHRQAVERVILEMRARFNEPLTLQDMAAIACMSPFHFDRIFHQIIGIPAVQFLYAVRIEAAKRVLLTTHLSITNVCYEVGYNSIGTFTSRFTQLVGLSPRAFRRLAAKIDHVSFHVLLSEVLRGFRERLAAPRVIGRIIPPDTVERLVFVGLFPDQIPQSRPNAGTLLTSADFYDVGPVNDGKHYVFAAAFTKTESPQSYLIPDPNSLLVGAGQYPVDLCNGQCNTTVDVRLRPLELTDPPILIALPLLLETSLIQSNKDRFNR